MFTPRPQAARGDRCGQRAQRVRVPPRLGRAPGIAQTQTSFKLSIVKHGLELFCLWKLAIPNECPLGPSARGAGPAGHLPGPERPRRRGGQGARPGAGAGGHRLLGGGYSSSQYTSSHINGC